MISRPAVQNGRGGRVKRPVFGPILGPEPGRETLSEALSVSQARRFLRLGIFGDRDWIGDPALPLKSP